MKTKQEIIDFLNQLNANELISIHNEYCESVNYVDDMIFGNDEHFFNEAFTNPLDCARAVQFGDWRFHDDFVKFDGYGNLESIPDYRIHEMIDLNAIAEDIIKNPNNYSIEL